MRVQSNILLDKLLLITKENKVNAIVLLNESLTTLNKRLAEDSWSALECIAHLNMYSDFYHSEIKKRIETSNTTAGLEFKSGVLGNYFSNMMRLKPKLNIMKTLKRTNPLGNALDKGVLEQFIKDQEVLERLLQRAKIVDLNKVKTSISINKWIKLKLGDTFRVVIYHNERHMRQAKIVVSN